jgi:TPR repeat protein
VLLENGLGKIREYFAGLSGRLAGLSGPLQRLIGIAVGALICILVFFLFAQIATYLLTRSYVDEIEQAFDLNRNIANALVWASFAAATLLTGSSFSLSRRKRRISVCALLSLLIGHSLVLAYATMNQNFSRADGKALKCYVVTRDSIQLQDHVGIDPVTGRECRPVTPEIAERVDAYKNGGRPSRIISADPVFFEPRTGQPITWYSIAADGEIQLFDLMGFQPETGEELIPVTKEIVARWKVQAARRVPKKVDDPDRFGPFDAISGNARLWYRLAEDGRYDFFDAPGYHPQTGEPLSIVTREIMSAWQKSEREKKHWYVITRDAGHPVRYCQAAGIDLATGRLCREITPQILERLREYEKGKRPNRVADAAPTFFDLRSGEPIVWYYKDKSGAIELFDLMGYHPNTGDELLPITKEAATEWGEQQHRRPARVPNRVQLGADTVLFDATTGAPRLWFSRKGEAEYEFFDGPGFNPRNADPLQSFTRDEASRYFEEIRAREKRLKDEQDKAEEERKRREAEDAQRRADLAAKLEEEQRKRDAELRAATAAVKNCDELAANPNDPRRVGAGVEYAALMAQAQDAIAQCRLAVEQNPSELRFTYQLARAMEGSDRNRAFTLLQDLVRQRYPAAYDNLGWIYLTDKHDPARAVALFRTGVQAGDPDAMLSLAEMIGRGHAVPTNESETKLELYRRAAQLGSSAATNAYNVELAREQQGMEERRIQLQQQQMMLQMFGGILQSIPRR